MAPKSKSTDRSPADDVRVLKPSQLESLKGGAQPGPDTTSIPPAPPTVKPLT